VTPNVDEQCAVPSSEMMLTQFSYSFEFNISVETVFLGFERVKHVEGKLDPRGFKVIKYSVVWKANAVTTALNHYIFIYKCSSEIYMYTMYMFIMSHFLTSSLLVFILSSLFPCIFLLYFFHPFSLGFSPPYIFLHTEI